ncbi:MAG: hypothetical protein RPS47_03005 [Colwellia sp.]
MPFSKLVIEDDVWIGDGVIITPSVSCIGRGAVVGAGAIVTKDVPRYAVVCGNPAVVIKYRFPADRAASIEESCWWLKDKESLKGLEL